MSKDIKIQEERPLVQDKECEGIVLGTIVGKIGAYEQVKEFLDSECFYSSTNREIWEAIVAVAERGDTPNLIFINAELRKNNSKLVPVDVIESCRSFTNEVLEPYALRLRDLSIRRKLWLIGKQLAKSGVSEDDDLSEIQALYVDALNDVFCSRNDGVVTLSDAFSSLYNIINKNMSHEGVITGTVTGFSMLDEKGGFQKGDLIIIGGESSQGKTASALAITASAIKNGNKVAFYSMEMMKEQLAARLTAMASGVSASEILYSGNLDGVKLKSIDVGIGEYNANNLFIDERSTSNIETIISSIRSLKIKYDIDGAVVDYLQILNVNMKNMNKEQMMADVARRLKNLAKDLGIWVIALSQLNRNSESPMPTLNRLRDSGQIAEAADIVMFVYRPEYYGKKFPEPFEDVNPKGLAMWDVAKGRNIGTFRFLVRFEKNLTKFSDYHEWENNKEEINEEENEEAPF